MVESCLNSSALWVGWFWIVVFWIFIILLSLIGLKWLIQESDKRNIHNFADNSFLGMSKGDINKNENAEKVKDKKEDLN